MAGDAVIVAGFGFRAAAGADSLAEALARAWAQACREEGGPPGAGPDLLATAADKAAAPGFAGFARARGAAVRPVPAACLARMTTSTRSPASLAARGVGSLAEASALAAAGEGAHLLGPRAVSADGMATCALAMGPGARGENLEGTDA